MAALPQERRSNIGVAARRAWRYRRRSPSRPESGWCILHLLHAGTIAVAQPDVCPAGGITATLSR